MTKQNGFEDEIFTSLRDAILSRRLAPGVRLREVQVAGIFGATRGAVRKAFDRLTFEGLIEHKPNRGASVAQPTAAEAEQLFEARKCVEVAVARLAARNLTPQALEVLEAHLRLEDAARAEADRTRIVSLSGEFHMRLAEIAGNAPLKRFLEDLVARESLIIQLFGNKRHDDCTSDEHSRIVAALASGEVEVLTRLIEAHIDGIAAGLDLEPRAPERLSLEETLRDV